MDVKAYFTLVQYVPDKIRGERINIAVILQSPEMRYARVRVRPRMDAILRCLWPNIDAEWIRLMVRSIEKELQPFSMEPKDRQLAPLDIGIPKQCRPEFLKDYTQSYGPIEISHSSPTKIRSNSTFKAKLDQLFELYAVDHRSMKTIRNITKEQIQEAVEGELQRRDIHYIEDFRLSGKYWENRFDIGKDRIEGKLSVLHMISFDIKNIEGAVSQTKGLVSSLEDIQEKDSKMLNNLDVGILLQPPIFFPENKSTYENALKAINNAARKTHTEITVMQNLNGTLKDEAERIATAFSKPLGFKATG